MPGPKPGKAQGTMAAPTISNFVPGTMVNPGHQIMNPNHRTPGYHVCIKAHVAGNMAPVSGASDDYYHWVSLE